MRRIGLEVVFAISLLVVEQAEGQPSAIPLIAVLNEGSASANPGGITYFKQALEQFGWVEGRSSGARADDSTVRARAGRRDYPVSRD